jgi:probable phosphoglycerate mutase
MTGRLLYLARHADADADSPPAGLSEAGRRQAGLLGERLAGVPFGAVWHGPLPRAAQTAQLVARHLPGVPLHPDELVGDYPPSAPDPADLPPAYAAFLDGLSAAELTRGPELAAAAIERFTRPDGPPELIVTHAFLVAWFVLHALDAPPARWLGLNASNAALTVIRYRVDRPPALHLFNDMTHLPSGLHWTGFPPALRP